MDGRCGRLLCCLSAGSWAGAGIRAPFPGVREVTGSYGCLHILMELALRLGTSTERLGAGRSKKGSGKKNPSPRNAHLASGRDLGCKG